MKIYFAGGSGAKNPKREKLHLKYLKYRLLSYYHTAITGDQKYCFEQTIEKKKDE
jgi:hypothetical protein